MDRLSLCTGKRKNSDMQDCGPDEPLSLGDSNNPFMMNTSTTGNESNMKKLKGDKSFSPSRVLHLRQIPSDATEAEVASLGLPFGKVTNLLMLKGKNQAFLEMASEEAAANMLSYYTPAIPQLRSQPVYIQYSTHKELKIDRPPDQARPQAALQAMDGIQSGSPDTASALDDGGPLPDQGGVLRVIVDNAFYVVTLEMLHQIFSKFGFVLKIVTFTRNSRFQALLEYADPVSAYNAKMALDGLNIYASCCTMRVDFSKLTSLKVKYNNDKSRDFTRVDLPPTDGHQLLELPIAVPCGTQNFIFPTFAEASGFASPIDFTQGLSIPAVPEGIGSPAVTTSPVSRHRPGPHVTGVVGNSVVLVTNLNPEAITPHGLFILFGMYGDVHRVKITFKKKENALVQMADATQAHLAISYLNGQRLYGRVIHASLSKHHIVQLPREGIEGHDLTKDYSNSPLHRFKKPGSKNFQFIFPPSATLHLANMPSSITDDDVKNLFASKGSTVKALRFFEKDCKTALIKLDSVEEALHALIELHNHDFGENHHLRISFSKPAV